MLRLADLHAGPTRCVILSSGGLDSSTLLALAAQRDREIFALSFDYGQRHAVELECADRQAKAVGAAAHEVVDLRPMGRLVSRATALIAGSELEVPKGGVPDGDPNARAIPSTYVPARNTLFLSYALAWAEALEAKEIWIGANALDYSGYPDCRPDFLEAWERMARLATRVGVEGEAIALAAPLVDLAKHEIVALGHAAGVDYADTVSCYDPQRGGEGGRVALACGRCESCELRRDGFARAGIDDPTRYVAS